ncbi:MAG: transaldolase phosphoglucose isomerase [Rhodospirillales bacterium]|nr:transaldolase phosphoglucose isomerase [Rhodospirillales bacterium]
MIPSEAPRPTQDLNSIATTLPAALDQAVKRELAGWQADNRIARLWSHDASLWTGGDEGRWLGWLDIPDRMQQTLGSLAGFRTDAQRYQHVLLLGMGGSSLGPEVLALTFGRQAGWPKFHVVDSTDPTQIREIEASLDLARTLIIVSSKSGSTLEPNALKAYFHARLTELLGAAEAAKRLIAVTDPGSGLQRVAKNEGFQRLFLGDPEIGGRYSVLSPFGLVPAAAMGLDLQRLIASAQTMAAACKDGTAENPGLKLGAILAAALADGRDKLTIYSGPGLDAFGGWAEQLIAESTGKNGHGIVPIDAKQVSAPAIYAADRLFVHLELKGRPDPRRAAIKALADAGHPVVRIEVADTYAVAQEFFRWEIATAVVGAIMGIHPFDQPDVESAKIAARKLTDAYEESGSLPDEAPILEDGGIKLYADSANAAHLAALAEARTLEAYLKAHLGRLGPGDYAALLAFLPMNRATETILEGSRLVIRDATRAAVCLGFGPRFLHSTGQVYKGGPNTGVFLQVTCEESQELPVPGKRYGFGVVKAAQARGDFAVLAERGRRALRVHLGPDPVAGLERLASAIGRALA